MKTGRHAGKIALVIMGLAALLAGAVSGGCQMPGYIADKDYVGTVVDEVTGEPIEGAIALAYWCKPDFSQVSLEGVHLVETRIEEVSSDKEGKVSINGFWKGAGWLDGGPYYEDNQKYPQLTVYKPGYVAWNYRNIFVPREEKQRIKQETGYESLKQYTYRIDFSYKNRLIKLERWREGYSHWEHGSFIENSIPNLDIETMKKLNYSEMLLNEYKKNEGEKAWIEFNK